MIVYKDKNEFKKMIAIKGFNPNTLSLQIGKCRQYIGQSIRNGSVGASSAVEICKVLNEEYENLFKII